MAFKLAGTTDPCIPKPITCITIEGIRVGTTSFRDAFTVRSTTEIKTFLIILLLVHCRNILGYNIMHPILNLSNFISLFYSRSWRKKDCYDVFASLIHVICFLRLFHLHLVGYIGPNSFQSYINMPESTSVSMLTIIQLFILKDLVFGQALQMLWKIVWRKSFGFHIVFSSMGDSKTPLSIMHEKCASSVWKCTSQS